MARYHFNPDSGKTGKCSATVQECKFKLSEEQHFATEDQAREAFEASNADIVFNNVMAKKPTSAWGKAFKKVGAAVLATVALTNVGSIAAHATPNQPAFLDFLSEKGSSSSTEYGAALDKIGQLLEDTEYSKDYENGRAIYDKYFGDGGGPSNSNSETPADGIYFQGKSIHVSPEELAAASQTLQELTVKPENRNYDYDRAEQFGRSFQTGVAGKLERRDVTNGIFKNDAAQARAIGGHFVDPYTGQTVEIIKGSSQDTNIDHIVPLHEVVKSEDQNNPLTKSQRLEIANDFDNLQVVAGKVNKQKSDKDPGGWMPSYAPSQKAYAISYINVKAKYNLSVDQAEYNALANTLNN